MRTSLAAITLAALLAGTAQAETIEFNVLGQPGSTGLIQKNKEQPFFETFAEKTGLDVKVNFQPLDVTGIKGEEELRVIKGGLFNVVSLRLSQISRDEPTILGLDLVGLNPTYADAKKSISAFEPIVDKRLQEKFNTKLLGVWPFGPQVLFCKPEIKTLTDLKGYKVRVYDQNLANFIASVGGIPVPLGFSEVQQSLARGVVDCAVTGPSSANSAAWPEVTTHVLPLAFQVAVNGYGINLDTWNKFSAEDQAKIQAAFDGLIDEIWTYSEELFDDAMRCNVGKTPCELNKPYELVEVPISEGDLALVQNAVKELSYPSWAETCDKTNPSCSADWKATVGKRLGM
ncbi:TRAP transporter substrate-binding protein [Breoghania sp. L-A4]|uniref:TRAP transporter substrate-binding protein n=1 Tax=Breoghania sp. L-A4 TaxID=2304600 RepID=UPI000E35D4C1|nr:TRAP transporter substrate-binding protein [Breoghania sp. L-A4]AXS42708.1 ABC transporter substrate-binding protein [Breoghania sp. L-A4]